MRGKRNSLSSEIMGIETSKKITQRLEFQKVIIKQQQVIKILQKQIAHLRQYLFYVADYDQINSVASASKISAKKQNQDQNNSSIHANDSKNQSISSADPTTKKISGLKGLIQEVMKIAEAKSPEQIIGKLKVMEEKANRKIEPVFVERIKQKEVPVTIQVVKEVEKQIIVEKIVQKIIEVPVFKEKIVEKYIYPDDSFENPQHSESQIHMKKRNDFHEVKNLNQTTKQRYKEKDQSYSEYSDRNEKRDGRFSKWDKLNKNNGRRYAEKRY